MDPYLLHPAAEVPVTDSKNSVAATLPLPRMSDYDADIDVNLRETEKAAKHRPSLHYLKMLQGDRKSQSTRASLVFLMEGVTLHFDLAPGTLHRAVSYVDRILSEATTLPLTLTHMEEYQLQVLAATAVYTAAKYEERCTRFQVNAAGIAEYCGFDTSKEVVDMERNMLAALRYELGGPTTYTFVHHFSRGERGLEVQRLAHQLAETSLVDYRCLQLLPSQIAASAVFLARLTLNPAANQVQKWNRDFEELTGYKPTDLIPCIQSLCLMNPDPRFDVLPQFFQDE